MTLPLIILIPLAGALALVGVPRQHRAAARGIALAATLAVALLALRLFFQFQGGVPGYQFVSVLPGLGAADLGITCRLGVDGLSVGLILMGAMVAFAATCVSWEIREREKEFYALLLVMTGGILGAFASINLFYLYLFHELALVPTFLMIGIWGRGERRYYATFQITLYLSVGALIALVGLVALYLQAGAGSFDLEAVAERLRRSPLAPGTQYGLFPLLLFGFGILVSLWPFHTWAPLAYSAAPSPVSMLHAGVLKKFGLYGLLRVAIPLLPEGARVWMPVLAILCLGNIVYVGLVAMRQRDLNLLVANSSVAHMGFIFLGLASLGLVGVTGAVVLMVAHGFLAALAFGLNGYLYREARTLHLDDLGGLARSLPFVGTLTILAMLAGCGLPGFANFIGEVMVFFGAWSVHPWITALAVWGGLVIGGVYMLRAIREVFHGPLPDSLPALTDLGRPWRRLPYALLAGWLILFGLWPSLLTGKIESSARTAIAGVIDLGHSAGTVAAMTSSGPAARVQTE